MNAIQLPPDLEQQIFEAVHFFWSTRFGQIKKLAESGNLDHVDLTMKDITVHSAPTLDPDMTAMDTLLFLNRELFGVIENTVPLELLARLFSSQLITKGERHLLDSSRVYYKILRQIISEGQQRGQIRSDITANEISKLYAVAERGLMYDWCICGGNYSLKNYAASVMPLLLASIREK